MGEVGLRAGDFLRRLAGMLDGRGLNIDERKIAC
jgi:hypothetical protein